MRRALRAPAALALALCAAGCAKPPPVTSPATRVSVQRPTTGAGGSPVDWAARVFPARYADPELPPFPPEAVVAKVARATVQADFDVLPDGKAHDVRLTLIDDVPEGRRFLEACAGVLERWRFSPAWRLAREGEDPSSAVVLLPSKAQLIFHFDLVAHLEGGDVQLTFGPGGR